MKGANQLFKYELTTKQIENLKNKMCLEASPEEGRIEFKSCNESVATQRWTWTDYINETSLENWADSGKPIEEDETFYLEE